MTDYTALWGVPPPEQAPDYTARWGIPAPHALGGAVNAGLAAPVNEWEEVSPTVERRRRADGSYEMRPVRRTPGAFGLAQPDAPEPSRQDRFVAAHGGGLSEDEKGQNALLASRIKEMPFGIAELAAEAAMLPIRASAGASQLADPNRSNDVWPPQRMRFAVDPETGQEAGSVPPRQLPSLAPGPGFSLDWKDAEARTVTVPNRIAVNPSTMPAFSFPGVLGDVRESVRDERDRETAKSLERAVGDRRDPNMAGLPGFDDINNAIPYTLEAGSDDAIAMLMDPFFAPGVAHAATEIGGKALSRELATPAERILAEAEATRPGSSLSSLYAGLRGEATAPTTDEIAANIAHNQRADRFLDAINPDPLPRLAPEGRAVTPSADLRTRFPDAMIDSRVIGGYDDDLAHVASADLPGETKRIPLPEHKLPPPLTTQQVESLPAGRLSPEQVPFSLRDIPVTRWQSGSGATVARKYGGLRYYSYGDSAEYAYRTADPSLTTGGASAVTETLHPDNPAVFRGMGFGRNTDELLRQGHDVVVRIGNDPHDIEVVKLRPGVPSSPRISPYVQQAQEAMDGGAEHIADAYTAIEGDPAATPAGRGVFQRIDDRGMAQVEVAGRQMVFDPRDLLFEPPDPPRGLPVNTPLGPGVEVEPTAEGLQVHLDGAAEPTTFHPSEVRPIVPGEGATPADPPITATPSVADKSRYAAALSPTASPAADVVRPFADSVTQQSEADAWKYIKHPDGSVSVHMPGKRGILLHGEDAEDDALRMIEADHQEVFDRYDTAEQDYNLLQWRPHLNSVSGEEFDGYRKALYGGKGEIVVSRRMPDGSIVRGKRGDLHVDLYSPDELSEIEESGVVPPGEDGFSTTGKTRDFMTREQATEYIRATSSEEKPLAARGIGPGGRFDPSEGGFISLGKKPPLRPQTPSEAILHSAIGEGPGKKMTSPAEAIQAAYKEMVNLDAPVERLGKRAGAPADLKSELTAQIHRVRGAAAKAENEIFSTADAGSLKRIWQGASDQDYHDWKSIVLAERQMELADREAVGEALKIDPKQTAAAEDLLNNQAPQVYLDSPGLRTRLESTRDFMREKILDKYKAAGRISQDQYDAILAKGEAYIPFLRVASEDEPGTGAALKSKNPLHTLHGGLDEEAMIQDPMGSIFKKAHQAERFLQEQKLRNMIGDLHKMPGFDDIHPAETKAVPVATVGQPPPPGFVGPPAPSQVPQTIFRRKLAVPRESTFPVWRGGVKTDFVAPQDVVDVANQLGPHRLEGALDLTHRFMRGLTRVERSGVTLGLEFGAYRNPISHNLEAMLNSRAGYNPTDFVRGLYHMLRADEFYDEAMRSGGALSHLTALDKPAIQRGIEDLRMTRAQSALVHYFEEIFPRSEPWQTKAGTPKNLRSVLGVPFPTDSPGRGFSPMSAFTVPFRAVGTAGEVPTRVGSYMAAKYPTPVNKGIRAIENLVTPQADRVGMGALSDPIAIREMRENIHDFARGGRTGMLFNGGLAFFNPEVQGFDRFIRAMKERPGPTALKAIAMFTLPAVVNWEMNHDDPEYRREPEWKRELFYRIPHSNGTGTPVPRGRGPVAALFSYGTEAILDKINDQDPEAANKIAGALVRHTVLHFGSRADRQSPTGESPSLFSLAPTAIKPELENDVNLDTFRGTEIENRRMMENLLPQDRSFPTTSPSMVALGKLLHYSPLKLEHSVRGHLGTLGAYGMDIADKMAGSKLQELPPDNAPPGPLSSLPWGAPLLRGLNSREPVGTGSQPVQDFYALLERSEKAHGSVLAARDDPAYQTEIQAQHPEHAYYKDLLKGAQEMAKIHKEQQKIRALQPSDTIPGTLLPGRRNSGDLATPERIQAKLRELDLAKTILAEHILEDIHQQQAHP